MAPACTYVLGELLGRTARRVADINIFPSVFWNKVTWKTVAVLMLMRLNRPLGKTEREEPRALLSQWEAGSVPGSLGGIRAALSPEALLSSSSILWGGWSSSERTSWALFAMRSQALCGRKSVEGIWNLSAFSHPAPTFHYKTFSTILASTLFYSLDSRGHPVRLKPLKNHLYHLTETTT